MSGRRVKKAAPSREAVQPQADSAARRRLWSLGLLSLATLVAAVGAGMPDDDALLRPAAASIADLFAAISFPITALLIVAALACAWPSAMPRLRPTPLVCGAGVLLTFAVLSAVASPYRWMSPIVLEIVTAALLAAATAAWLGHNRASAFGLFAALWTGGLIIAVVGLREYLEHRIGGRADWRVFGPFADPNFLAGYLVITLPIGAGMFLGAKRRALAVLAFLALLFEAGCILETQSRLGVAALGVGMIVFAGLLWRSGAIEGPVRRRAVALVACVLIAGVLFARPMLGRLRASAGEAYSAKFRMMTWRGTEGMANAHPLLGVGPGAFAVAYPRYAVVGWTRHAHNTYVQLASEIGYPGTLGFLIMVAGALAAGTLTLRRLHDAGAMYAEAVASTNGATARHRNGRSHPPSSETSHGLSSALGEAAAQMDQRLIVVALVSAIIGSAVHNLFDSDLYVPSIALAFAVVCGLVTTISREATEEPSSATWPDRAPRVLGAVGGVALALLMVPVLIGRLYAQDAQQARDNGDLSAAADAYRSAASADAWNADYPLGLASVLEGSGSPEDARRAYERAIALVPSAKALRRYAKLLDRTNDAPGALRNLLAARRADPHDLQTLLALAQHYEKARQFPDALAVYRDMTAQSDSPIGRIRAVPEIVDWEYGVAHLKLGQDAAARRDIVGAESEFRQAVASLGGAWFSRGQEQNQARAGSAATFSQEVVPYYDSALQLWATTLDALGRTKDAAAARARQAAFRQERDAAQKAAPATP